MEVPTREKLKKKKVVELRAELSKFNLPQAGIKDILIDRLIDHYKAAQEAEQGDKEPVEQSEQPGTEPTPVEQTPAAEAPDDGEPETMDTEEAPPVAMEVANTAPTQAQDDASEMVSQSVASGEQDKPPTEEQTSPAADREAPPTDTPSEQPATQKPQQTSDYYSAPESSREEPAVVSQEGNDGGEVSQEPAAGSSESVGDTQQNSTDKDESGKKKKKKKRRRRRHDQPKPVPAPETASKEKPVEIEYVQEDILKPEDPHYRQFHKIFEAFKISDMAITESKTPAAKKEESGGDTVSSLVSSLVAKAAEASKRLAAKQKQEDSDGEEEEKEPVVMTKKKLRKLNRLTVAQLKQLVDRPDVVEMHDVTALDPKLLIHLKSTRNTVPVPRHWCFKRKYLQGKRGIEKPPFHLPEFIAATGIMEMRQALEDKEDTKSLKQKTRERVRPKMGKLTIDYQKLHDAFFRFQTKPKMSCHGDLYYEGKEFETRLRQKKPGDLSDDLRRALGMTVGAGKNKFPPPWLVAMQRYGPPPSYPNLKIAGLNAPIPEGCSFGYFVGGWGKPPVDDKGRPLYGDVFGLDQGEGGGPTNDGDEEMDKAFWGELESEEEESEEESDEDEEEPESPIKPEDIKAGLVTPMEGLATPSGLTSIPAGLETPEMIQLRKKKIEEAMEAGGETPALYTVLPEKTAAVGGAMMGSSHVYDIGQAAPGATKKSGGTGAEEIEVALDPSELDLDTATMTARYEEQMKEKNVLQKEDLSDMVAEHAAKKKRKRPVADTGGSRSSKKLKEFKF